MMPTATALMHIGFRKANRKSARRLKQKSLSVITEHLKVQLKAAGKMLFGDISQKIMPRHFPKQLRNLKESLSTSTTFWKVSVRLNVHK